MRRRHAVLDTALVLAGLAAACAQSVPAQSTQPGGAGTTSSTPPDTPPGPATGPTSEPGGSLVRGAKLGESEIATETKGAWTYRRTAAADGGGSGDSRGAETALSEGKMLKRHAAPEPAKGGSEFSSAVGAGDSSGGGLGAGGRGGGKAPAPGVPAAAAAPPAPPKPGSAPPGADAARTEVDREAEDSSEARPRSKSTTEHLSTARALRAGSTDDNADFPAFVEFLDAWQKRNGMTGGYQPLDVRTRRFVRVVDSVGRPVPAARVAVVDETKDRVVGRGTAYGDGRVPLYPNVGAAENAAAAPAGGWFVEVRVGDKVVRSRWDGNGDEHVVHLDTTVTAPDSVPIDVAFLIDTTGSMGDEIASIQACLLRVTAQIWSLARETDLRCGTVLYRDVGDEYLTATHPLTADIGALDRALRDVRAGGGGDGPESLNQGLAETVDGLQWREGAAKVVFLIADAPPHMDYAGDTPYGESVRAAVAKGIRVHTVAASGLDEVGTLVFRQIAQFTRGKFVFLEYGSGGADAKGHGVGGEVKHDNLEDILFGQIRDEVAHFGR